MLRRLRTLHTLGPGEAGLVYACLPACLNSPCHCRCHALRAGEAERAAALEVAEERCAAVAELLDDVQELQGRVEQVGIRACAATTTAVCIACW